MTFFGSKNKIVDFPLFFDFVHLICDVFETDQKIADALDAVFQGDFLYQRCGDIRFDNDTAPVEAAIRSVF